MVGIFTVALGIGVFCLMMAVCRGFKEPKKDAFIKSGVGAIAMMFINFLASKVPVWLAIILFLATLAMSAYLVYWWMEEGSTRKELLCFFLMALLLFWVSSATIVRVRDICHTRWLISILESIPIIVFIMSFGYMVANYFWYNYDDKDKDKDEKDEKDKKRG